MTAYTHELVIVCPLKHAADQSNLSACWSRNFSLSGYESANRYRCDEPVILKGTVVTQDTLIASQHPPQRHPDDTENLTDMEAARRGYERVVIIQRPEPDPETGEVTWPAFPKDKTLAFIGVPLAEVEQLLALTKQNTEDGFI